MSILGRIFIAVFFTAGLQQVYCQVIDVSTIDSTNRFSITKFTSFLNTTRHITIDSIVAMKGGFSEPENKPVLMRNYDPYYYWFRIIIKNPQPKSRQVMLLMAPIGMYEGLLFQKINNRWRNVAHAGLKYRLRDRSYQFTHHVFPFNLAANKTDTLYVSIDASNAYKSFGFALMQPSELKLFENKIYFIFGIIVGLLLLFFVLNVSLAYALKEKLHLWYALYIALLFLIVMKNDHLDQQFLGLDSERGFRLTPYMTIGAFAIIVLIHVVQNFLKSVLRRNRFLVQLTTILKINILCSAIVHAFVFLLSHNYQLQSIVFSWAKMSTVMGMLIIMANCLYCSIHGFKGALFLFFGSLVFMIGSVQRLYFPSTLSFLFPPTTFHIGIIVETFVISLGLIYRYRYERKLQRRKQEEEKELLRLKEDEIQVQTMHLISEEIHDTIGQSLALAILNLETLDQNTELERIKKLSVARDLIRQSSTDIRDVSRSLKNDVSDGINIREQIKTACNRVESSGGFKINFKSSGEVPDVEIKKQGIVIRIIKGILQNAIKHSHATEMDVRLTFTTSELSIIMKDNGVGFDLKSIDQKSNGLQNIMNRCRILKATCNVESNIGGGTRVSIQMPVE